ncbi:MAG TPA: peptide chain release factor N(5)-glutamine methyltransferase [Acholeplasmataceae bacterium]|nr:peptide chain release factor N(5)-glutamine methyltransferase [Acholeplasmataceae bacterium]
MTYEQAVLKAQSLTNDLDKKHSLLWLFIELLEIDHSTYYMNLNENLNDDMSHHYFKLVNKYLDDLIPVQYLVGHSYFYGRKFYVNDNTLIPRSETEMLVLDTIDLIKERFLNKKINVLDLATGTGCIGITLKLELNVDMTISDISEKALDVARKNVNKHDLDIKIIKSDWFGNINDKFDVIIANPPYIPISQDVMDIVNKEPSSALYSGIHGLDSYQEILKDAKKYLNENAIIAFEHGYDQKDALYKLAKKHFKDALIIQKKDLANLDRYTYIICGDKNE